MSSKIQFKLDEAFKLKDQGQEADDKPCKGLFWRGVVNSYFSRENGRIETRKQLNFLKRKSCPGCSSCEWILEEIESELYEDKQDYLGEIESGKIYKSVACMSQGYFDQYPEFDFIDFVEVKGI